MANSRVAGRTCAAMRDIRNRPRPGSSVAMCARLALGGRLREAGLAACREIAAAAKGLEIAHLQFVFRGLTLAVCSRVRRDGILEIEIGMGDQRLPKSAFTAA